MNIKFIDYISVYYFNPFHVISLFKSERLIP